MKSNQLQTGTTEILEAQTKHYYEDKFNALMQEEEVNGNEQEQKQEINKPK